jgi:hypothetical protein
MIERIGMVGVGHLAGYRVATQSARLNWPPASVHG